MSGDQHAHESTDPLSFKGQMAARYRERMTMGFALGNSDNSNVETSTPDEDAAEEAGEAQGRLGVPKAVEEGPQNGQTPRQEDAKRQFLSASRTTRSRSNLGEPGIDINKPAMKDLITKFERRSFTSTQLRHNDKEQGDGTRMARDAWGGKSRAIKLDIDPSALTSSSSSEDPDSRSLSSVSRPPCAKPSRGALSLNVDMPRGTLQNMLSASTISTLPAENRNAQNAYIGQSKDSTPQESKPVIPESSQSNVQGQQQQAANRCSVTSQSGDCGDRGLNDSPCSMKGNDGKESSSNDKAKERQELGGEEREAATAPPLRVSLRGIATRRKLNSGNSLKYIVHKKEWGKKTQSQDQASIGDVPPPSSKEHSTIDMQVKAGNEQDNRDQTQSDTACWDTTPKDTRAVVTTPSNTQQRIEKRGWTRQREMKTESRESVNEERKSTAMDRYLQFLKRTYPIKQTDSNEGLRRTDKTEARKALRPPTPHRTQIIRKAGDSVPRRTILTSKEAIQTASHSSRPASAQAALLKKQNLEKEARTALLSHFRPRSVQTPPALDKKETTMVNASGGDLRGSIGMSSSISTSSAGDELSKVIRPGQNMTHTALSKLSKSSVLSKAIWPFLAANAPTSMSSASNCYNQEKTGQEQKSETVDDKLSKHYTPFLRRCLSPNSRRQEQGSRHSSPLMKVSPRSQVSPRAYSMDSLQAQPKANPLDPVDKKLSREVSDLASHLLTEDELADNELIPSHLREKKTHRSTGNIPLLLSSSDDSYSMRMETPITKIKASRLLKMLKTPQDERPADKPAIIDTLETQYLAQSDKRALPGHHFLPKPEAKPAAPSSLFSGDARGSPENKTGWTPENKTGWNPENKTGWNPESKTGWNPENKTAWSPQNKSSYTFLDAKNSAGAHGHSLLKERLHNSSLQPANSLLPNSLQGSQLNTLNSLGKSGLTGLRPLSSIQMGRDLKPTNSSSTNPPSHVVPDEFASGSTVAEPDRFIAFDDRFGTPKPHSPGLHGDELKASAPNQSPDKAETDVSASPTRGRKSRSRREGSITRREASTTPIRTSSSASKERSKEMKDTGIQPIEGWAWETEAQPREVEGRPEEATKKETSVRQDAVLQVDDCELGLPPPQHPFHFGESEYTSDVMGEQDTAQEKLGSNSPQKKKRKVDKTKKLKKKKKKKKEGDDEVEVVPAQQKGSRERMHMKDRAKERPLHMKIEKAERTEKTDKAERPEKTSRHDRSERHEKPERPDRTEKSEKADRHDRAERERPERPERVERPERPERVERPERPERVERPERPERVERPEKAERPEKTERPERGERHMKAEKPEKEERQDKVEKQDRLSKSVEIPVSIDRTRAQQLIALRRQADITPPRQVKRPHSLSREPSAASSHNMLRMSPKDVSPSSTWQLSKRERSPEIFPKLRPVRRLSYLSTEYYPFRSQIPIRLADANMSRKKLDVLIQYRRWKEAILDCLHPSRIPLSDAFRKRLDSAVVEEWALHCWQPSREMYVDSQGVWWSASVEDVQDGTGNGPLLGDGSIFSKEGILDLGARLPYLKVGPLRVLHASYLVMGVVCLLIGHMGVKLYHCGGDEYEYYCQDDDLECLMQLLTTRAG